MTSRNEYAELFTRGKVATDGTLVVHALRAAGGPTRLGLSMPKKVGNAPHRNRWKRLIREAFRRHKAQLPSGLLLIVRPRRGARPDSFQIERSLLRLAERLDRKLPKG